MLLDKYINQRYKPMNHNALEVLGGTSEQAILFETEKDYIK
jgi:hypothetical protein